MSPQPARVLTIGGSDSGGAAGLQADLKTWTALGVYGMSAITAVTAQNSVEVKAVSYLAPEMVTAQIEAVLSDYGAQVVKTGFIGRAPLTRAIAGVLERFQTPQVIVDPVLVNHRGESMFEAEVIQAYRDHLLPISQLITPNWREAALLAGSGSAEFLSSGDLPRIVDALHALGARQLLITGDVRGAEIIDYWSDGRRLQALRSALLDTENVHGSGDTLSAAICAFLARGEPMERAIKKGRAYTNGALQRAVNWQLGHGHGPLAHF